MSVRQAKSASKHRPLLQRAVCRTTPGKAVRKKVQTENTDWTQIEAALSRHFSRPIQLFDPAQIDLSADQPGGSLGGLADSDRDELWYPPAQTPLFYGDGDGRLCEREEARFWTFAGSPTWFRSDVYPPPPR